MNPQHQDSLRGQYIAAQEQQGNTQPEIMAEIHRLEGTLASLQGAITDLSKRLQPVMAASVSTKNVPQPVDTQPTSILGNRIYGARQQAIAASDEVLALLRDLAI